MTNPVSRAELEHRKKYHAREQEKARRKMVGWQQRFDMHAQAHWECTKRLIEGEIAEDIQQIDDAINDQYAADQPRQQ